MEENSIRTFYIHIHAVGIVFVVNQLPNYYYYYYYYVNVNQIGQEGCLLACLLTCPSNEI